MLDSTQLSRSRSSSLVSKLRDGIGQGVALVTLAGLPACSDGPVTEGTDGGPPGSLGPLSPYPLDKLGCYGPFHDGAIYGQCCVGASCYAPEAGAACVAAAEMTVAGSGDCGCDVEPDAGASVLGPFAPNSSDPALPPGECCYLKGLIGCAGRPLLVAGRPLLASVVRSRAWLIA